MRNYVMRSDDAAAEEGDDARDAHHLSTQVAQIRQHAYNRHLLCAMSPPPAISAASSESFHKY